MSFDDFMGGDKLPAYKFTNPGDTIRGQICNVSKLEDRAPDGTVKKWPDGSPMHVFVFDLATGLDGNPDWAVWVRGNMVTAVREALRSANLKPSDRPILTIKHTELGEPTKKGYAPPKLFKAKAEPAPDKPIVVDDDF
jgi:hypothetical protein